MRDGFLASRAPGPCPVTGEGSGGSGSGRVSRADKARAYAIARGECVECVAAVEIAGSAGDTSAEHVAASDLHQPMRQVVWLRGRRQTHLFAGVIRGNAVRGAEHLDPLTLDSTQASLRICARDSFVDLETTLTFRHLRLNGLIIVTEPMRCPAFKSSV
jgi:hypothetical protein